MQSTRPSKISADGSGHASSPFPSSSNAPASGFTSASSSSNVVPKRRPRVDSSSSNKPSSAGPATSTTSSSGPDSKRVRSEGFIAPTSITAVAQPFAAGNSAMSVKALGKQREVIDLTGSSLGGGGGGMGAVRRGGMGGFASFQPHSGARKLVIKNLRTTASATGVDEYYRRTWAELEAGLNAIFAGQQPDVPLERLYRGVEDTCRNNEPEKLYELLRQRCEAYLSGEVLNRIRAEGAGGDNVTMLRAVLAQWKIWSGQLNLIRSTFSYLDRGFLINRPSLMQINDLGIDKFRRAVFNSRKDTNEQAPGASLLAGMCELVDYDRRGDANFDAVLLKESITMLHVFNVYNKSFEPIFLEDSHQYFMEFAEEKSANTTLKGYINACERLLKAEDFRCMAFNFDSTTKRALMEDAHHVLIVSYTSKLLHSGSVSQLLADNEVESVKALYDLLELSGIQQRLKDPWEEYIRKTGSNIVQDVSRGDEMVVRLLLLRKQLDVMIRDALQKNEDFTYAMREAFGHFINDTKSTQAWDTDFSKGSSKVAEMIAKYIDMLLRGGMKTLPESLRSDSKDRAEAEQTGLASTGDEDAELDRQLDQGLELFRFIEGKDTFEAFYKRDLARRLLMNRSASNDAERSMLGKLREECGASFTHNLEQMFKDQELAKDEMTNYKSWLEGRGNLNKDRPELSVSVLSAAAWPSYDEVKVLLPPNVVDEIALFDGYYKNKHTGRRLNWMHNLATCVLKAKFNKGIKELSVSAFQAAVLVLFNDADEREPPGVLTYEHIQHSTGLQGAELERTLQSLACGRTRVLTKAPKGKDVNKTDTFTVNKNFTDPKFRVKINQIQLKETREENVDTHRRVAADRQFETQAAIVRIMKSRKTMTHAQLVAEVINQTKSRGAVDAGEIKKNIEKLIEKEYLERDGSSYNYMA